MSENTFIFNSKHALFTDVYIIDLTYYQIVIFFDSLSVYRLIFRDLRGRGGS